MSDLETLTDYLADLSKGAHFAILLDEHLKCLEPGLQDEGFKVALAPVGLSDEEVKRRARNGFTMVTRNAQDFLDDAARLDYDVIGIEGIAFLDPKPDRTNTTVRKIAKAIRESHLGVVRGNFFLRVQDEGRWELRRLI